MVRFLDLQKQYQSIKSEIDRAITEVIAQSAFVGGRFVEKFEEEFAAYCGVKHCIGVANGTDALEIALWSLQLPPHAEVIVPANSFIATSEAVTRSGAKVVFCDCTDDYTMCPTSFRQHITPHTVAVIPVHLYGQPARMNEILSIAKQHNLYVIEDAAQAHGAKYCGEKAGSMGTLATFSFYPGKNLGAYGDGGAIVTNSDELAAAIRQYANHGRSSKFLHEFEGRNSRLDGLQAAILSAKLPHLDAWLAQRNRVASWYSEKLSETLIRLPVVRDEVYHAWHLYVVQHPKREQLKEFLLANNIQCGVHYSIALPKLNAYRHLKQEECSNFYACKVDVSLLSLPMGEHLGSFEVEVVTDQLNSFR